MLEPSGKPVGLTRGAFTLAFILFFAFIGFPSFGQMDDAAQPAIRNFNYGEFHSDPQSWSVIHGMDGMLYVGNNNGLLQYDGVNWVKVSPDKGGTRAVNIRSLVMDSAGTVYYGSRNEIGYIRQDSLGHMVTHSLFSALPDSLREFGDVWTVQVMPEGLIMQSRTYMAMVSYPDAAGNRTVKVWNPETRFMYTWYVDGVLYVHQADKGLYRMVNNQLEFVPGSEPLGLDRCQIMLRQGEGADGKPSYLFGTFVNGFYRWENGNFTALKTPIDGLAAGKIVYKVLRLRDGRIAIASAGAGLFLLNDKLQLLQQIDISNGLQNSAVYGMAQDRQGMLWLALDNGISRIDLAAPIKRFARAAGIEEVALSLANYKETMYVGLSSNAMGYDAAKRHFVALPVVTGAQVFTLLNDGHELLISGNGLHSWDGKRIRRIASGTTARQQYISLFIPHGHPNALVASGDDQLRFFHRTATSADWQYAGALSGLPFQVYQLLQDADGAIWGNPQGSFFYRFTMQQDANGKPLPEAMKLDTIRPSANMVSFDGQMSLVDDTLRFSNGKAMFHYHAASGEFVKDEHLSIFQNASPTEAVALKQASSGDIWVSASGQAPFLLKKNKDGGYEADYATGNVIAQDFIQDIIPDSNNVVWFITSDGLISLDAKLVGEQNQSYQLALRRLTSGGQQMPLPGALSAAENPDIAYRNNTVRFEYAAMFFSNEDKTRYQTWLEGFEKDWSDWDANHFKEFTNLPRGQYKFHVRARNVYGKLSNEVVYSFTILAPWYAQWWAILLYLLLGGLLIFAIVRNRTRQFKERQRELEKLVHERTGELSNRVEELETLKSIQEGLVKEIDASAIYELVGSKLYQIFDTHAVLIRNFDKQSGMEHWQYAMEEGQRLNSDPRPINWANRMLIEQRSPLYIKDHYKETAMQHGATGVSKGKPPKSALFVPLLSGGEVMGSLSLQNLDKEHAFTESDVRLVNTVANSMSMALENSRLLDTSNRLLSQAEQRASEMATVNEITQALVQQLNISELIALVGEQLRKLFKANIVYLALLDEDSRMISFPYQYGDDMPPMRLGEGLTSTILKTGKPLLVNKDLQERRREMGVGLVGKQSASYLGVPISVGDKVGGVLSVQSTEEENRFTEDDLRLLNTIAGSVGIALRKARLFEELNEARLEADNARKGAEKANQAKSAFLSTVSHELRTPLTSVLGFAKIIRKRLTEKIWPLTDASDPKTAKAMEQIDDNLDVVVAEGQRLTHLINDVLDLAKIEAGKMEWNMEPVSLAEVAERAIAATSSLFENSGLSLDRQFDRDLPMVNGDKDKLIQVMVNLLSNAVKFTPKGQVHCSIKQRDDHVEVTITDSGIGIAPKDHDAVFEQFKQVGDTLTDKPKGTGLGLPICKEIVEYHGGRIWLDSQLGKGSSFSFSLPTIAAGSAAKPLHLEDLVRQLKVQVANSQSSLGTQPRRVLVVDDDDSIRSLLNQELTDAGYFVEEARNGKDAIGMIRENRPDLVILDIMMPEMNGFDVAAVLKNDPLTMDIPIIVLSIVQDKVRGFRIGVDRYLTKPIDTTLLFSEIGTLLDQGKSKKKVLVVDEDNSTVNTLTEVLRTKGYQVLESDGNDLVQKAVDNQPDIIIIKSGAGERQQIIRTLRFEKGLENVLFLVYQ